MNILVINGPNLNLLGKREPEIYGTTTLEELNSKLTLKASEFAFNLHCFQSNFEGEIINKIQESMGVVDFIIINPAAFTHYSIGIRDALLGVNIKFIEVHLSNIYKREEFRQKSFFSDIAIGTITGFGTAGYFMALEYIKGSI